MTFENDSLVIATQWDYSLTFVQLILATTPYGHLPGSHIIRLLSPKGISAQFHKMGNSVCLMQSVVARLVKRPRGVKCGRVLEFLRRHSSIFPSAYSRRARILQL